MDIWQALLDYEQSVHCTAGLVGWQSISSLGWWLQHGESGEARKFFPVYSSINIHYADILQYTKAVEWLREIHLYESRT